MRILKVWLLVLIFVLASPILAQNAKKVLGDLNGDGVKEVAVEGPPEGNSCSWFLKIFSGKNKKMLLRIGMSGDTADDYKVVGKQIVVWQGNWDEGDKFSLHRYDFTWYAWDKMNRQFQVVKDGRTKESYSYDQACRIIPRLAVHDAKELVIFWKETKVQGPKVESIYLRAQKLPKSQRDKFILIEIGQLHCREREERERLWFKYATAKEMADLSEDAKKPPKYSVYIVNIYHGWAQIGFCGGPVEPGAEVYRKNTVGRWELIAEGNEFSGWLENGTIPKDVAKHIGI